MSGPGTARQWLSRRRLQVCDSRFQIVAQIEPGRRSGVFRLDVADGVLQRLPLVLDRGRRERRRHRGELGRYRGARLGVNLLADLRRVLAEAFDRLPENCLEICHVVAACLVACAIVRVLCLSCSGGSILVLERVGDEYRVVTIRTG